MYAARVYLQSDGQKVQVWQAKKDLDSPEYIPELGSMKTADLEDAQAIGELIQAALKGQLRSVSK